MSIMGSFKYDFETSEWIVFLDDNPDVQGSGMSPECAIVSLRFQANKHDLWPKDK